MRIQASRLVLFANGCDISLLRLVRTGKEKGHGYIEDVPVLLRWQASVRPSELNLIQSEAETSAEKYLNVESRLKVTLFVPTGRFVV